MPPIAPELTSEQHAALHTRDVSVALAAGAGCGKTFVLTERFLSHLDPAFPGQQQPARLPELVAITFTERAAREMRDRIRRKCHERVMQAATAEQAQHWLELLRELDSARVSTFHSFCGSLLRAHAVEAGLDPSFRILEESQAATLLTELIDDQLRQQLSRREPAVMDLAVKIGLEDLREKLMRLLRGARTIDFESWRNRTPDEVLSAWTKFFGETACPALLEEFSMGSQARAVLSVLKQFVPVGTEMLDRRSALLDLIPALADSSHPAANLEAIHQKARVSGTKPKDWPSPEVYTRFKDAATALRECVKKLQPLLQFDAEGARLTAECGLKLLSVAEPMVQAFAARKHELSCLDFDDLLISARKLLTDPRHESVRRRAAAQIRLLLVDEFQDTDPLQVELVEALCDRDVAGGKLFFVGDYKQSIYRFRGADPQVFSDLTSRIHPKGQLPLSQNFRSQPAILAFVNALFRDDLHKYAPLHKQRPQVSPTPAIEFLWAPKDADAPIKENAEQMRRREARWIARRLRQMLDSGARIVWDQNVPPGEAARARAIQPRDIALLFRALSDVQYYEEALRDHGIDYYLVGGHAFYTQQEIFDLLNLLRAIDIACDEVSLAGALRSPFFSLADETLFWLVQHKQGLAAGLFASDLPPQLDAAERRRAGHAAATLRALRAKKNRLPIADLINEALARTGYDAVLVAEFLGERKLANLRKQIDGARSFDRTAIFTLSDFITQLSELVAEQPKEPLAATHPETTDVVRLMTIHSAKGLEFPVVVVPDLSRREPIGGYSARFHPQLGPLIKLSKEVQPDQPLCGLDMLKQVEALEDSQERLRLLYVATTRAADYLMLSSSLTDLDAEEHATSWMKLLSERFDLLTGQMRVELPGDYEIPAITVTTTEPPLVKPVSSVHGQRRILQSLEAARQMALAGDVPLPPTIAPAPVDARARRQFSFSRLSGALKLKPPEELTSDESEVRPTSHRSAVGWDQRACERRPTINANLGDHGGPARPGAACPTLHPLELGTLVHAVLEEVPFGSPFDVALAVQRLAPQYVQTPGAPPHEAIEMISRFLSTSRAAQLAAARQRHVELEFLLAWPPGNADDGCRYLEGVMDCLYQDAAGDWQLLDYKTNQVTAETLDEVAAGYEMQMLVYALAAERILKITPKTLVLHFLRPGLEKQFELNDQSRRRALEMVDRCIAAFLAAANTGEL